MLSRLRNFSLVTEVYRRCFYTQYETRVGGQCRFMHLFVHFFNRLPYPMYQTVTDAFKQLTETHF